jgi:hypothetical protein
MRRLGLILFVFGISALMAQDPAGPAQDEMKTSETARPAASDSKQATTTPVSQNNAQAFMRTAWLFAEGSIAETVARKTLKGYSLNNGRVAVPTSEMKFFAPLSIDGNFKYIDLKGVMV